MMPFEPNSAGRKPILIRKNPITIAMIIPIDIMNYTPTKVGGFWEHEVVFRMLYQYSEYLTYRTSFSYHG